MQVTSADLVELHRLNENHKKSSEEDANRASS